MLRPLALALLVISLVGFVDASYLTLKHYQGEPPTCSILAGCEVVTTSRYATIYQIPVALLGALYYLAVFLGAVAYLDTRREVILRWLARLTVLGFLATLWFFYLQAFVIGAYCLYCLVSAATSTLLFVLGIQILYYFKKSAANNKKTPLPLDEKNL
ncbi:MAG: vitamin K epoxide reductase family protein [Candidatus Magasanikbacteria bacterium]|nr:vitamin K epoxide reductase family protein [Candidatus Magasanikbacteria bacterium]